MEDGSTKLEEQKLYIAISAQKKRVQDGLLETHNMKCKLSTSKPLVLYIIRSAPKCQEI